MFPPHLDSRPARPGEVAPGPAAATQEGKGLAAGLRVASIMAVLASAWGQPVSAQSIGTMQVTARVISGSASWAALDEVRVAVRWLTREESAGPPSSGAGLLRTRAEIQTGVGRRRLVVTVDHPRN